jgi:hypothetical protein
MIYQVGFEVLTVVSMKIAVFWVVAPCSLVEVYQSTRLHGATTQKTAIFMIYHFNVNCILPENDVSGLQRN